MRIKQIQINHYGPLNQIYLPINPGVQAIYGDNESGKTLLVDAMIKHLTGGKLSEYISDRVDERPEGYIVLEDKGQEYKIDHDNDLSDYLEVTPDEIRNIFVIRNSDLEIPEEPKFYERTYQRLTGLRTDDIRAITDKIKEIGRLTDKLQLKNSNPYDYPADNVKNAKKIRRKIESYLEETTQEGIDETESELYIGKLRKEELEEERDTLREAKKLEEYRKLETAIENLDEAYKEQIMLPSNEQIFSVNQKLDKYLESNQTRPRLERKGNVAKYAFYGLLAVTLISWMVIGLSNFSFYGYTIPILFAVGTAASGLTWYNNSSKISHIDMEKQDAMQEANQLDIEERDTYEIRRQVKVLKTSIIEVGNKVQRNLGVLKERFEIKSETPEEVVEKAKASLSELGKSVDFDLEVNYDSDKEQQIEAEQEKLEEELKKYEESLEDHYETLRSISKDASDLAFKSFMGKQMETMVTGLESLRLLRSELSDFIDVIELDERCAECAAKIFKELEGEEEEKITDLFSEGNLTSKLFSKLTDGRYDKVYYNNVKKKIFVERPSGQKIEAYKLSKGAYDQLYFAIRVDLSQRMLEGRGGFMILDDAFLSSGTKRFQEGIEIMKEITDKGWNLIYLTVKDYDAEKIEAQTGNEMLSLNPLP
jgi:hypothetical protein